MIAIAAIVVILAALFLAWRAAVSTHTAKAERAVLAAQCARLEAQLRIWDGRQAKAEKQRAVLVAVAPSASTPAERAATNSSTAAPSLEEWLGRLAHDPKFQVLHLASERAKLAASYGPLFHRLGLSPTQIEKLSDLLMGFAAEEEDLRAIARTQGLSPRDPALTARRQLSTVEVQAAESALLGGDGFAQLQDYERALPAWKLVGNLAGCAALADIPLSREQAVQLAGAVADSSRAYARGGKVDFAGIDWTAADARAQTILSSEQMKFFARADPPGESVSRWTMQMMMAILHAGSPPRRLP